MKMRLTGSLLASCVLLLLPASALRGSAQSKKIYGAYQDCPFHCRTIRINPDFTFDYRLEGDLYNVRAKGTWKFIGKNRIRATIPEDTSAPRVTEERKDHGGDFFVTVIDEFGAAVKGAEISGTADGHAFKVFTNEEGVTLAPKTSQFEIRFGGYRGVHKVSNLKADSFVVTLTKEQMSHLVIDEIWMVEGKRLYIAQPEGLVEYNDWLDKLSREKERKIFQ
jgi:hypothetical protein